MKNIFWFTFLLVLVSAPIELEGEDMSQSSYVKTENARGYMHPLSEMSLRFIEFSKQASPVMDMGCAYGNLVRAVLEKGTANVIACDMDERHLNVLQNQVADSCADRLTLVRGLFPYEFSFNDNTIGGIYVSHLLEYLNDKEMDLGLAQFYRWLQPGGKLFIKAYTIFIKELINERFQKEYQNRLEKNVKWPGYLENYAHYSYPFDEDMSDSFPASLHMYDLPTLTKALQDLGFELEFAEYLDGKANGAREGALHDGREYIGIIAVKPEKKNIPQR